MCGAIYQEKGMVSIQNINSAQLVWNDGKSCHESIILELLAHAEKMDCMVAFARTSSLDCLIKALEKALARGMKARFAVGLSLYVTDPSALRQLMDLSRRYRPNFKLYLSNCNKTFHPKVYAFTSGSHYSLVVGSANLTEGGFHANHEASVLITGDQPQDLVQAVSSQLNKLIDDGDLVPATDKGINQYARMYMVKQANDRLLSARLEKAEKQAPADDLSLREILEIMRADSSPHGFEEQMDIRDKMLADASRILRTMAKTGQKGLTDFLPHYEKLIKSFHSGGLVRSKGRIAEHASQFLDSISQIKPEWKSLSAGEAFELLHSRFSHITGAGINILTEILHVTNNRRFAVMNQNSVSGLEKSKREGLLISSHKYPPRPSKSNVSPSVYAAYCQDMRKIQKSLGLSNFTELDALFNYAYWKQY